MMNRHSVGFTQNQLKLLALFCMTLDHIGYLLLPQFLILRILGRLAFPIFAYSIYEGCKYTHRPLLYLLRMAGLGLICAAAYYFYEGEIYGNILITFSLSICILLGLRYIREGLFFTEGRRGKLFSGTAITLAGAALAVCLCRYFTVDYGFYGVLLPVFAEVFDLRLTPLYSGDRRRLQDLLPMLGFAIGAVLLSFQLGGGIQYYCCLALPLLALSNGKRGRANLKYLFYIYYPLHLAALELISFLFKR